MTQHKTIDDLLLVQVNDKNGRQILTCFSTNTELFIYGRGIGIDVYTSNILLPPEERT